MKLSMIKTCIIRMVTVVILASLCLPSISISACPEGNTCSWIFDGSEYGTSLGYYYPQLACSNIWDNLNQSLPNCTNYGNGSVVYRYGSYQDHYNSNNSWTHCTWITLKYHNVCTPIPTCNDFIQNQGEAGIDCGGPCPPCCYPSSEVCDGVDNDCDGLVDEGVKSTYYRDADGDGYGGSSSTVQGCSAPGGFAGNASDCKDDDPAVNPGNSEICGDGKDNDCSGSSDCLDSACTVSPSCFPRTVTGGVCSDQ
jgi:hypothetical protein